MIIKRIMVSCLQVVQVEDGVLLMQGGAFLNQPSHAALRSSCIADTGVAYHASATKRPARILLTDPKPESATDSLPESVVCVFLCASE